MKLKLFTASILSLVLLTGIGTGQVDGVEAADSLKDKKKQVEQNLNQVEKDILKTANKVNSLNEDVAVLETAIETNNKEVDQATNEVAKYDEEVKALKEEIKGLKKEIEERNVILKERLSSYQNTGGDLGYLEVIFGSVGFEDFISRFTAVTTITKADNNLIEEQKKTMKKVETKEVEVEEKLKEAEETKSKLEKVNKLKKDQKAELVKSVASVETEIKKLEGQKSAYIKEGNDIKALEEKAQIELAAKKAEKQQAANEEAEKENTKKTESKNTEKSESTSVESAESAVEKTSTKKSTPKAEKTVAKAEKKSTKSSSKPSSNDSIKEFSMQATAYTAKCTGCSGITATGINLNNNPNAKVVAVDPSVIPLGSRVWVSGYGEAIAGDTGGDIKGNRIDLHYPNKKAAYAFGRGNVTVKILK